MTFDPEQSILGQPLRTAPLGQPAAPVPGLGSPPDPPRPASGARRPRRTRLLVIAAAAVLLVAVGVGGYLVLHRGIEVHGSVEVTSPTNVTRNGVSCFGTGGLFDMQEGTKVTVTDQNGQVVALTTLQLGQSGAESVCVFPFEVTVPAGRGFYGVEVGQHGVVHLSEADLAAGPQVTVGG